MCAREHLRPAVLEEMGQAWTEAHKDEELTRLLEALGKGHAKYSTSSAPEEPLGPRPAKRLQTKTAPEEAFDAATGAPAGAEAAETAEQDPLDGADDDMGLSDDELLPISPEEEVHMLKHKTTERTKKKQQEKEIAWKDIAPEHRPLYAEAAAKQCGEWLQYDAVEPMSIDESEEVEMTHGKDRILPSRSAYKDKNAGKREGTDADLPIKAKARLCVGGHRDPELEKGHLRTDAPTITWLHLLLMLNVCRMLG